MRDDRDSTMEALQREIAEMQSLVLYYENRILRKRIAIEEIVQSKMCGVDPAPVEQPAPAPQKEPSVRKLAEALVDQGVLDYYELKKRLLAQHPERAWRIKRGLWQVCHQLIEKGKPIAMPPPRQQHEYQNGQARTALGLPVDGLRG